MHAYAADFAQYIFADKDTAIMPHAKQIAQLGQLAYERGQTVSAANVQPFYLRNKVALTTNERVLKAEKVAT